MKKLDAMLEEYGKLKRTLEAKGYSGIVQYQQVGLRTRISYRLFQLVTAGVCTLMFSGALIERFADGAIIEAVVMMIPVLILWALACGFVSGTYCASWEKRTPLSEALPMSRYLAKIRMRAEIEILQLEILQLGGKDRKLRLVSEKISEITAIIENQLGGEVALTREVGKNPYLRVTIVRDEILAKIICCEGEIPAGYKMSVMDKFMDQFVRLDYDVFKEGALAELQYNVEILLEWKKTKAAEKEIKKRFMEEVKRSK